MPEYLAPPTLGRRSVVCARTENGMKTSLSGWCGYTRTTPKKLQMALFGNVKARHTDGDSCQGFPSVCCRTGAERLGDDRCSYSYLRGGS